MHTQSSLIGAFRVSGAEPGGSSVRKYRPPEETELPTHPHASFFYILTSVHAAHLLGGIAALTTALIALRRTSSGITSANDDGVPSKPVENVR